ncbi:MAG: SRPBCC family protein [Actinomycetota bacterium]|nr:SRPBCC family protein [Actinomycetota bacterium]
MTTVEQSIEVNVPVRTAYNQWTQFEDFPQFMEGVQEVKQITDTRLRWHAQILGVDREWEAEIDEQTPDQRIAWHAIDGTTNAGVVTFHRLDDGLTKVMLQLELAPEGIIEKAGDWLGLIDTRVKGDLERFKTFIEGRGGETGAWRGEVEQDTTR